MFMYKTNNPDKHVYLFRIYFCSTYLSLPFFNICLNKIETAATYWQSREKALWKLSWFGFHHFKCALLIYRSEGLGRISSMTLRE